MVIWVFKTKLPPQNGAGKGQESELLEEQPSVPEKPSPRQRAPTRIFFK